MKGPKHEAALRVLAQEARILALAKAEGAWLSIPFDLRKYHPRGLPPAAIDQALAAATIIAFEKIAWTKYDSVEGALSPVPIFVREVRACLTDAGKVAALEITEKYSRLILRDLNPTVEKKADE